MPRKSYLLSSLSLRIQGSIWFIAPWWTPISSKLKCQFPSVRFPRHSKYCHRHLPSYTGPFGKHQYTLIRLVVTRCARSPSWRVGCLRTSSLDYPWQTFSSRASFMSKRSPRQRAHLYLPCFLHHFVDPQLPPVHLILAHPLMSLTRFDQEWFPFVLTSYQRLFLRQWLSFLRWSLRCLGFPFHLCDHFLPSHWLSIHL